MILKLRSYILLLCCCLFLSSCKITDPFIREAENSSLNLALIFLEKFENPMNKKTINFCYEKLSSETKKVLDYPKFFNSVMLKFPRNQIFYRKVNITPWEKFDLNNGSVIVYLLKKYNFRKFRRKFGSYAIERLLLIKENEKWAIKIENPHDFKNFRIIFSGAYSQLNDSKVEELRKLVKKDAEEYQFDLDKANMDSQELLFAKKCIAEGEKLYDSEEYRKALMQFQKALSIDPKNVKALTYIDRCKKAISFELKK